MNAIAPKLPRHLGRYEIVGKLASGGMAEILLARLTGPSGFERPVVIKRILPHLHGLSEFVDMFLDEGRIAARIGHPNVAQVQELAREDDELYLVMEYLEGESAAGLARRARARRTRLAPALCAYIVAEACAGLHAAHELRSPEGKPLDLVHRDVSPQNLFVGYDGTIKVLDFGIAKAAGRITTTEAGTLKGKFEYMSPEQAAGQPLDRRSDVFSLGIVLYELATQRRLFKRGSQTETLRAVCDDPIVPPSELVEAFPAELEAVCLKALARDPDARYASANDFRRALLGTLRTIDASAMPEESLSTLMHELFDDRIEEKHEMLAHMRDGITPAHVPAADVEEEELPTVEAELRSAIRTRLAEPARRARWPWIAAVVLIAAGAAFVMTSRAPEEEPTAIPHVEITVESEPSGAQVVVDGNDRGVTPLTLTFEQSEALHTLRLGHEGYAPLIEEFRADVNQRIRLPMQAEEPPEARRETVETEAMTTRRRRRPTMNEEPPSESMEATVAEMRSFRRFN